MFKNFGWIRKGGGGGGGKGVNKSLLPLAKQVPFTNYSLKNSKFVPPKRFILIHMSLLLHLATSDF